MAKKLLLLGIWVFFQTFLVTGFAWCWGLGIQIPPWKMLVISAIYSITLVAQSYLFTNKGRG